MRIVKEWMKLKGVKFELNQASDSQSRLKLLDFYLNIVQNNRPEGQRVFNWEMKEPDLFL